VNWRDHITVNPLHPFHFFLVVDLPQAIEKAFAK